MKLYTIHAGNFKLDGGAMFGVVPKSMWQKLNPPDQNNMCIWSMQCLLIEMNKRLILIDTGMGTKQDDKFRSFFSPHGAHSILSSLKVHGFHPNDITDVILSHLHFDHCGGAVERNKDGNLQLAFPNAIYWSNEKHWNWALKPNERERASFLIENFELIQKEGRLKFIESNDFRIDEFSFPLAFGHTEAMITPTIKYRDTSIIFAADLMPSSFHIPMPYVMAYDVRPLETLKEKKELLNSIVENKNFIFFEHDPKFEIGNLKFNDSGKIILDQVGKLTELVG